MKIHELFADPAKWTDKHAAVDAQGREVDVDSPAACAWCLIGAIAKCYPRKFDDVYRRIGAELPTGSGLSSFNTSSGHAVVHALVRGLDL